MFNLKKSYEVVSDPTPTQKLQLPSKRKNRNDIRKETQHVRDAKRTKHVRETLTWLKANSCDGYTSVPDRAGTVYRPHHSRF